MGVVKIRHVHEWLTVVGIVHRPDGSMSDGRFWCRDCDSVLDFRSGRWRKASR